MDQNQDPITYQQVTVDVPEDRLAEFHAFFARFLAGRTGRGRGRRHGARHLHRHGCARRSEIERAETTTSDPATPTLAV